MPKPSPLTDDQIAATDSRLTRIVLAEVALRSPGWNVATWPLVWPTDIPDVPRTNVLTYGRSFVLYVDRIKCGEDGCVDPEHKERLGDVAMWSYTRVIGSDDVTLRMMVNTWIQQTRRMVEQTRPVVV
jgi:hypothetical protein